MRSGVIVDIDKLAWSIVFTHPTTRTLAAAAVAACERASVDNSWLVGITRTVVAALYPEKIECRLVTPTTIATPATQGTPTLPQSPAVYERTAPDNHIR